MDGTIQTTGIRRLNPDGTCDIRCKICGRFIYRRNYDRFSTATCVVCYNAELAGKTPDEMIYARVQDEMRASEEAREVVGQAGFKASGFRKRVVEVVTAIRERVAAARRSITKD